MWFLVWNSLLRGIHPSHVCCLRLMIHSCHLVHCVVQPFFTYKQGWCWQLELACKHIYCYKLAYQENTGGSCNNNKGRVTCWQMYFCTECKLQIHSCRASRPEIAETLSIYHSIRFLWSPISSVRHRSAFLMSAAATAHCGLHCDLASRFLTYSWRACLLKVLGSSNFALHTRRCAASLQIKTPFITVNL